MILFSHTITDRLRYITEFIGKEISGEAINLTSDTAAYNEYKGPRINYSREKITPDELWIVPHTLLFENNILAQAVNCFDWNDQKVFFLTNGDLPFDIFAASFYLLSRYEEYLPHQKDMYGRYSHENSLAFKEGFLHQPLVNNWLQNFATLLKKKFPLFTIHHLSFLFLPTYDIDIAWSYRHKGWWRNAGGLVRSLFTGQWKRFAERIDVLTEKGKDPYDAYSWMNHLHGRYKIKPYYFFLIAERSSRYDKNISPGKEAMKALIHDHAIRYPIGIHPSWRSGDDFSLLKKEIDIISAIVGNKVQSSRQHYIRFTLPMTFRRLLDNGIQFDFSMGYGGINGFRASVTTPFYWYDLKNEKQTSLLLFPFCFMDANSFYEQKNTPAQALREMHQYYNAVSAVSGIFSMIWHNSFLGTDPFFAGWREVYEQFIQEVAAGSKF